VKVGVGDVAGDVGQPWATSRDVANAHFRRRATSPKALLAMSRDIARHPFPCCATSPATSPEAHIDVARHRQMAIYTSRDVARWPGVSPATSPKTDIDVARRRGRPQAGRPSAASEASP